MNYNIFNPFIHLLFFFQGRTGVESIPAVLAVSGVPGGNPHKHGENLPTPHKDPSLMVDLNSGRSSCEATVLTAVQQKCYCYFSYLNHA